MDTSNSRTDFDPATIDRRLGEFISKLDNESHLAICLSERYGNLIGRPLEIVRSNLLSAKHRQDIRVNAALVKYLIDQVEEGEFENGVVNLDLPEFLVDPVTAGTAGVENDNHDVAEQYSDLLQNPDILKLKVSPSIQKIIERYFELNNGGAIPEKLTPEYGDEITEFLNKGLGFNITKSQMGLNISFLRKMLASKKPGSTESEIPVAMNGGSYEVGGESLETPALVPVIGSEVVSDDDKLIRYFNLLDNEAVLEFVSLHRDPAIMERIRKLDILRGVQVLQN